MNRHRTPVGSLSPSASESTAGDCDADSDSDSDSDSDQATYYGSWRVTCSFLNCSVAMNLYRRLSSRLGGSHMRFHRADLEVGGTGEVHGKREAREGRFAQADALVLFSVYSVCSVVPPGNRRRDASHRFRMARDAKPEGPVPE